MLFDEIERSETRPKRERESIYDYLNSSARNIIATVRKILEQWFDSYPDSGKAELRARLRSPIDAQYQSAFWELYLYELFSQLGFTLEPHPTIEGSSNHPDFLVKQGEVPVCYLEAVLAGVPSKKDIGAEARLAEVFDLVNKMQIKDWFLHVEYCGMPNTPPSVKELRKGLEDWLKSLDANSISETLKAGDWDNLPQYEWQHDGLTLTFNPAPKSAESASKPDLQPIGVIMGEPHLLHVDKDIRQAVESKAKKYGTVNLPFIVAVNVLSEHCDKIDIDNALFGTETVVFSAAPGNNEARPGRRLPDGIWFGDNGRPRRQTVSAVLVGDRIDHYACALRTPLLIHNPFPAHKLSLSSYLLPQSTPDSDMSRMIPVDGISAKEVLRLPEPWPPVDD